MSDTPPFTFILSEHPSSLFPLFLLSTFSISSQKARRTIVYTKMKKPSRRRSARNLSFVLTDTTIDMNDMNDDAMNACEAVKAQSLRAKLWSCLCAIIIGKGFAVILPKVTGMLLTCLCDYSLRYTQPMERLHMGLSV